MEIIIFGAPGAGKGTQSKILSEKYNLLHLSTGDLLRKETKEGSDLGKTVEKVLSEGKLVSDEMVAQMVENALTKLRNSKGYILDGFPRTVKQAEILSTIISENNFKIPIILNLTIKEEVIVNRLSSRRQCSKCKSISTKEELKEGNICPNCGSENTLFKREDDEETVIKNRIKIFNELTLPVLQYYKNKNYKVIEVLGTDPINVVTENIIKQIS